MSHGLQFGKIRKSGFISYLYSTDYKWSSHFHSFIIENFPNFSIKLIIFTMFTNTGLFHKVTINIKHHSLENIGPKRKTKLTYKHRNRQSFGLYKNNSGFLVENNVC